MKAASTAISPTVDRDHLAALTDSEGDAFKRCRFFGGLLQSFEGLGARVELAARARDEPAWLHVVDLDALLAFGREAKLGLGLEPIGLGEDAQ